jgi:beta-glucosidase
MTVARLVFPALRWRDRDVDGVWPEVRDAIDLGVGGFVVFGGSVSMMRQLYDRTWDHAGRPLLFAADLERGAGQQLAEATPLPAAAALATLRDQDVMEVALLTAQEAAAAGIGWVLAPVADLDVEPENPIIGTRSFGPDPAAVAARVAAWIKVVQMEGVLACAKHFPGHGRTTADSHSRLPVVSESRPTLEEDLVPFRAAVEAGVASVMMAHVAYPALDASRMPASLSPAIVGILRNDLDFGGLIVTDAMIMEGVAVGTRAGEPAAVTAIGAGCDVVLYPKSPRATVSALEGAVRSSKLNEDRVAESVSYVERLAGTVAVSGEVLTPLPSYERALDLAARSVKVIRGALPRRARGARMRLHIIDDDRVGASVPRFAAPGQAGSDRAAFRRALLDRGINVVGPDFSGTALHLIAVYSDVRAWKDRSGLAPQTVDQIGALIERAPEATVVLFAHPRLAEQLPHAAHVICAWSGEPLMQEAVAQRLMADGNG